MVEGPVDSLLNILGPIPDDRELAIEFSISENRYRSYGDDGTLTDVEILPDHVRITNLETNEVRRAALEISPPPWPNGFWEARVVLGPPQQKGYRTTAPTIRIRESSAKGVSSIDWRPGTIEVRRTGGTTLPVWPGC